MSVRSKVSFHADISSLKSTSQRNIELVIRCEGNTDVWDDEEKQSFDAVKMSFRFEIADHTEHEDTIAPV